MSELAAALEAVLFAAGRAVPTDDLARAAGEAPDTVRETLAEMQEKWKNETRGTELIRLEDSWQMCTKKEYYPQLIALELNPKKPRLTDVLLETLSVIAYRQPVTKAEIESIRGVNSDHAVNRLISFGLVEEVGRAKMPGRPILLGTTEEFLRAFGVASKDDLPEISPAKEEDFREEAEKEADEEAAAEKDQDEAKPEH